MTSKRVDISYEADAWEIVNDMAFRNGWTDGLPIVPPTEERVRHMLESAHGSPDDVVAEVAPMLGVATYERVAVNAVMAGCLPEYFPVVLAAVDAMCDPAFNLDAVQTTTSPCTVAVLVNGPIRRRLDVNSNYNCLGQGWRSNATIGRAVRLVLLNIGGGHPGVEDKCVQGTPAKYTCCFAEAEELTPWSPLHVERGFKPSDDVVTVISANSFVNCASGNILSMAGALRLLANAMSYHASNHILVGKGEPFGLLTPTLAQGLKAEGFAKDDVKQFLYEHSGSPAKSLSPMLRMERVQHVIVEGVVRPARRWQDMMVFVAGGEGIPHSMYIPTFGDSLAVSRRIRSPG